MKLIWIGSFLEGTLPRSIRALWTVTAIAQPHGRKLLDFFSFMELKKLSSFSYSNPERSTFFVHTFPNKNVIDAINYSEHKKNSLRHLVQGRI